MLRKQEFTQDEYDKIRPSDMGYIILNNLHVFDDKPEMIEAIIHRFNKLDDPMYSCPLQSFNTAFKKVYYDFYEKHNHFPDMAWIASGLRSFDIKVTNRDYSSDIYDDFVEYLDRQIIKRTLEKNITDNEGFTNEDLEAALNTVKAHKNKKLSSIKRLTREESKNLCRQHEEEPPGIKTGIEEIDDILIELPCGCLSVLNAPSGAGKTLISSTILYNTAVLQGKHVLYVAFEASERDMLYNLTSIESTYENKDFSHSTWKLRIGGDKDKEKRIEAFEELHQSLFDKVDKSGGYINILTQKTMPETSFEEFLERLEKESELKGKKVDLIVLDNFDGIGLFPFKGSDFRSVMNQRVVQLESFAENYHNNEGVHILILSQSNREGIAKLEENSNRGDSDEGNTHLGKPKTRNKRPPSIDYRVISEFSALYHKSKIAMVCNIADKQRRSEIIQVYFLKVRDTEKPAEPIEIKADFAHSRVGGKVEEVSSRGYLEYQKKEDDLKEKLETNDIGDVDYDFQED